MLLGWMQTRNLAARALLTIGHLDASDLNLAVIMLLAWQLSLAGGLRHPSVLQAASLPERPD